MKGRGFEKLEVFLLAEKLADSIWRLVVRWDGLAKRTLGAQMIRSADSIGANIAEGSGRGNYQDNKRFVRIARGSLYETRFWLRRAFARKLLTRDQVNEIKVIVDELSPRLNAYLKSIGRGNAYEAQAPASDK